MRKERAVIIERPINDKLRPAAINKKEVNQDLGET